MHGVSTVTLVRESNMQLLMYSLDIHTSQSIFLQKVRLARRGPEFSHNNLIEYIITTL